MPGSYPLSGIEIRAHERKLLVKGEPILLGARAFDVLMALRDRRDRVVTKEELLDAVWPGLVVEENNLAVHVSALRKALGRQAIVTVPGRGYRFVLDEAAPDAHAPPEAMPASLPRAQPAQPLPFMVGQDAERRALLTLVREHALVSIIGPGGVGKTTMARVIEADASPLFPDGVAWADLGKLEDPALIPGAIAQAMGLQLCWGGDPCETLATALAPMALLLVLDNAEHVLAATANCVVALRKQAPAIHLLVTSQAPLHMPHEQVLRLKPLPLPEVGASPEAAMANEAVALFMNRARLGGRGFALTDRNTADVVDICRRLDGLPLALELAAARVSLLGVKGVAQRLDDRFGLLAVGQHVAWGRRPTLQAAFDWTVSLLPHAEQALFHGLSVFCAGFSLALVTDTLVDEGMDEWSLIDRLALLVDFSLVQVDAAEPPRYTLIESVRAHAWQQCEPRHAALQASHAQAVQRHFAPAESDWLHMSDEDWLAHYEPEFDNLRAALRWALVHDEEMLVALVGSAAPLWHCLSRDDEASAWHERCAQALQAPKMPKPLLARWWRAAQWAWARVSPARAIEAAARARALYEELGDDHGLYAQLTGLAGLWAAPHPVAQAALNRALALERPEWPPRERAWGRRAVAEVARSHGRLQESREARLAELALRMEAGDSRGQWHAQWHLADLEVALGHVEQAIALSRELVDALQARRSDLLRCRGLQLLLHVLLVAGDIDGAAALASQVCELAHRHDLLWMSADDLAWLAAEHGRPDAAALLTGWSDKMHRTLALPRSCTAVVARDRVLQRVANDLGDAAMRTAFEQGAIMALSQVAQVAEMSSAVH